MTTKQIIALTNTPDSPLGRRADVCIDVGSGPEIVVPASKSVTSTAAIPLWAAELTSGSVTSTRQTLMKTAEEVHVWLDGDSGYGVPVAYEFALKLKEASYVHAEGFSTGEFRHGSSAILDSGSTIIGIADESSREIVCKALDDAQKSESLRYVVGAGFANIPALGLSATGTFNELVWLVVGHLLALYVARERDVECDAPRGLVKAMI